jgi:hypothetical protein
MVGRDCEGSRRLGVYIVCVLVQQILDIALPQRLRDSVDAHL